VVGKERETSMHDGLCNGGSVVGEEGETSMHSVLCSGGSCLVLFCIASLMFDLVFCMMFLKTSVKLLNLSCIVFGVIFCFCSYS
jgi:hypothetical protein